MSWLSPPRSRRYQSATQRVARERREALPADCRTAGGAEALQDREALSTAVIIVRQSDAAPVGGRSWPALACLESEIAQRCVIIRPAPERPTIFALAFRNRCIVDAGDAHLH
jgi:hypothetical protein